jgi:hypothetical protein
LNRGSVEIELVITPRTLGSQADMSTSPEDTADLMPHLSIEGAYTLELIVENSGLLDVTDSPLRASLVSLSASILVSADLHPEKVVMRGFVLSEYSKHVEPVA